MDNKESNKTSKRFAAWMQRQFEGLSRKGKIAAGLLTFMLAGSYCGLLILGGISGRTKNIFSIDPIRIPVSIGKANEATASAISTEEFERIHRFREYMDSLARSPSSRARYDSLVRARPGLMDSIVAVEDLYSRRRKEIDLESLSKQIRRGGLSGNNE